jgi:uncharacterized protein (UPF0128 family)
LKLSEGGAKVSATKVDISELRRKYSSEAKKLVEFLEEKLQAKIDASDTEITLKAKEKGKEFTVRKDHLRVLLKRFLHKQDLKEEFRIITGKEGILSLKERKARPE